MNMYELVTNMIKAMQSTFRTHVFVRRKHFLSLATFLVIFSSLLLLSRGARFMQFPYMTSSFLYYDVTEVWHHGMTIGELTFAGFHSEIQQLKKCKLIMVERK